MIRADWYRLRDRVVSNLWLAQGLVDPADATFATTADRQGIGRGAAETAPR